jgi:hypothetical protein
MNMAPVSLDCDVKSCVTVSQRLHTNEKIKEIILEIYLTAAF